MGGVLCPCVDGRTPYPARVGVEAGGDGTLDHSREVKWPLPRVRRRPGARAMPSRARFRHL